MDVLDKILTALINEREKVKQEQDKAIEAYRSLMARLECDREKQWGER